MDGLPLYVQVRNSIKNGIEANLIRADNHGILPSQEVFAREYKVSLNTVKRALAELERTGLVESHRGKGLILKQGRKASFRPATSAGRMLHIGIAFFRVFREDTNSNISKLIEGVEDFGKQHNIALHQISFPGLEMNIQETTLFSNFPFMNLDGLLLLSPVSSVSISRIKEKKIPYVSALNLLSDEDAVCHVGNAIVAAFLRTDAVLRKGLKNIIFFAGNRNKLTFHHLLSGFNMAFLKHGLLPDMRYVSHEDYNLGRVLDFIDKLIEKNARVDAVMAFDDETAAGINDFLLSRGKKKILVAGAGNFERYKDKVRVTIGYPFKKIGYNSIKTLFEMINGVKPAVKKFYYEPVLIDRSDAEILIPKGGE